MNPEQFFAEFESKRRTGQNKLCDELAAQEDAHPGVLTTWESLSSSGDVSSPVGNDEYVIRGITEPHWDEKTNELAPKALTDIDKIGLSVKRAYAGESMQDALARALEDEERRMAAKRALCPEKTKLAVTGVSVLEVRDIRAIVGEVPAASGQQRRAYYVFNSNAKSNSSHADVCSPLCESGSSALARRRARSDLLQNLIKGYRTKESVNARQDS